MIFQFFFLKIVLLYRGGKKERGLGKTSRGSKAMLESKTSRTLLVGFLLMLFFPFEFFFIQYFAFFVCFVAWFEVGIGNANNFLKFFGEWKQQAYIDLRV